MEQGRIAWGPWPYNLKITLTLILWVPGGTQGLALEGDWYFFNTLKYIFS